MLLGFFFESCHTIEKVFVVVLINTHTLSSSCNGFSSAVCFEMTAVKSSLVLVLYCSLHMNALIPVLLVWTTNYVSRHQSEKYIFERLTAFGLT